MKVVPITKTTSDGRNLSLTVGKQYEVLGIEADLYRILNDPGTKPYGNDPVLLNWRTLRLSTRKNQFFRVCQKATMASVTAIHQNGVNRVTLRLITTALKKSASSFGGAWSVITLKRGRKCTATSEGKDLWP